MIVFFKSYFYVFFCNVRISFFQVKPIVTSMDVLYLTEGTSYNLRVMAENSAGISEPAVLEELVVPQSPYSKEVYARLDYM